ncbi:MAG: hypothetical protein AAGF92_19835 [Myxococcota bacterium]
MAVLAGNLRSATFKHGLSLNLDAREGELADRLELHLTAKAGAALVDRLPKSLRMCFPVFSKRHAKLTVALNDERTVCLELEPTVSRDAYKALMQAYCGFIAAYFAATDDVGREAALDGARFDGGIAHFEIEDTGDALAWRQ